ncbi:MAG: redoxin domain-containing protein [Dehalococcoidia bacterium]
MTGVEARAEPVAAGDVAPDFTLPAIATDGEEHEVRLSDALKAGPVMLVFYQDDGMPICTSELKAFAQEHDLLRDASVQVFGINTNGTGSHQKFQERDRFPFSLISDFHGEAVKAYGMWDSDERKSRRGVVIVAQDGTVQFALPHFSPGNVSGFEDVFRALGLV